MPKNNVHIYREMRIVYLDVEADTPAAAAEACRDFPSDAGCDPVDCDGQTFAAVVNTQDDPRCDGKDVLFEEGKLRRDAPAQALILDLARYGLMELSDGQAYFDAYYEVEAENARSAAENWSEGEFSDRDDEALESEGPCSIREQQPDGTWRILPPSEWEDEPPAANTSAAQLFAVCRMVVERWERGDLAEAARACSAAIAEAEAAGMVTPADRHVVYSAEERGYWSNQDGWGRVAAATIFTAADRDTFHPPIGGAWVTLKPYAVLLLYPDYANDGGTETYYAWVDAHDPVAAVGEAQRQAVATNEWSDTDPTDFAPLLVIEGHHCGQPMSSD